MKPKSNDLAKEIQQLQKEIQQLQFERNTLNDGFQTILAELKRLKEQTGWHSTSEEPPQHQYLVVVTDHAEFRLALYSKKFGWNELARGWNGTVIRWASLPKWPEE